MKKRLTIVLAMVAVLLAALALLARMGMDRLHNQARKDWKNNAIAEIKRNVADSNWLSAELNTLRAKQASGSNYGDWSSDRVIAMSNGDWLVYASKCSKDNWRIHDIFIAQASNGKWYYSTYHFCSGMIVLHMEEQPPTLVKFIEDYCLREFDGHSDQCLELTWPTKTEQTGNTSPGP